MLTLVVHWKPWEQHVGQTSLGDGFWDEEDWSEFPAFPLTTYVVLTIRSTFLSLNFLNGINKSDVICLYANFDNAHKFIEEFICLVLSWVLVVIMISHNHV